jgi:hypothetical protein
VHAESCLPRIVAGGVGGEVFCVHDENSYNSRIGLSINLFEFFSHFIKFKDLCI